MAYARAHLHLEHHHGQSAAAEGGGSDVIASLEGVRRWNDSHVVELAKQTSTEHRFVGILVLQVANLLGQLANLKSDKIKRLVEEGLTSLESLL